MDGEILFLAHRLPFPPDRGDKIRSHHILKAIAKLAPVHVGCLAETDADYAHESELAALAASYCMPRRNKPLPLAGIEALVRNEPVSLSAFRSAQLSRWVRQLLQERDIRTIYVFSGQMGQFLPAAWGGRLVVDLVDVDSAKFEALGEAEAGLRGWINRREGRLLHAIELALAGQADRTLLVSEAEAALLRQRVGRTGNVTALRNGIDTDFFDPKKVAPAREITDTPGPHIVFTGQMDYAPNVEAAMRFAERILPAIRQRLPDATFHIVGRAPVPEVRQLGKQAGARVWGAVPDVRPFTAAADLVTAPLALARGVQNKVLEAMAMEKCVLLSPEAATGIDARNGTHFVIADNDGAMIAQAIDLLTAPDKARFIGAEARRLVRGQLSWPATLASLPEILSDGASGMSLHAA